MEDFEALKKENANLKIAFDVLISQLSALRAENAQLKTDSVEAAKPRPKITPTSIALTNENIEKLVAGLKGHLHPNAVRKKKVTVAIQLITMHNLGTATSLQLRQASGLSFQGFSTQSLSVRKAGLMVHPAYKKYLLSDKAKEILNKVFGE
jgi:hypothetical protein